MLSQSFSEFLHFIRKKTVVKSRDVSAMAWPISKKIGKMTQNVSIECNVIKN